MSRFWSYARPYLPSYLVGLVLLFVTNGLALWIPWLLRGTVDAVQNQAGTRVVAGFAMSIVGVAVAQAVTRTWSRWTILGNSRKIVFDVRNLFFDQLQRLGASYYDTHRTGDIMSRGINDIQLLQSFYGPGVMNLLNTSIVYVATIVLMLGIDVRLTLTALTLYPLLFFGVNRISKRVYARSLLVQEQLAAMSNQVQENISGIQQVKTYAQEDREIERFGVLSAELRKRNLAMSVLRGAMISLIGIVTGAGTLIVLWVGGRFVIEGRITFGDFVAFNAYLGLLAWPTIALGWIINTFQRGSGALLRLSEVLDAKADLPAATDETETSVVEPVLGGIEVRDLTFVYSGPGDKERGDPIPALRKVSLSIEENSRVALVGPVGSGKSTLANLLARVYPVPEGTIFIGGIDITGIPVSRLRRSVGYVPQEAFLFSRSLRENVTFGYPDVTEDEVTRALEVSNLARDLPAFPAGLETIVGERGFTLSGGQRQRATLARALVGAPRILILDDSLSSVDADTERAILTELDRTMTGRTTILISNRLSTLAVMDRIVVLDDGRVVEEGTHAELIGNGGLYARLFSRQALQNNLEQR